MSRSCSDNERPLLLAQLLLTVGPSCFGSPASTIEQSLPTFKSGMSDSNSKLFLQVPAGYVLDTINTWA